MQLPDFLSSDEFGGLRLAGHRITLYHLLAYYNEGYTAEMLLEQFPTLSMALIHRVLAYYWEHKVGVDIYLEETSQRLNQLRAGAPTVDVLALRERLQSQQAKQKAAG